jgi:RNA 2',3'-cyclic 3'-phosphodiesterase
MNPEDVIRSFLAIEISEEVRERLKALQQDLKKAGAKVGWVAPENIHLTLVFLGDLFRSQVEPLANSMDEVAAKFSSFHYEVAGSGFFGSPRLPRVLWVGVHEPAGAITDFQTRVLTAVRELGLKTEDRPFHPHLTIGRVRTRDRVDELTSRLASAKSTSYGSVEVHRLLIMQSHLERQGVRYSILHESALKGAT